MEGDFQKDDQTSLFGKGTISKAERHGWTMKDWTMNTEPPVFAPPAPPSRLQGYTDQWASLSDDEQAAFATGPIGDAIVEIRCRVASAQGPLT
mgnify:CR=1 FL=1